MIHLYYTYSVSKLPYRRAFISATSNREFPPDFLKVNVRDLALAKYEDTYLFIKPFFIYECIMDVIS